MRKISVIIPVYNEEKTLLKVIQDVFYFSYDNYEKEIIIINDGSTDKSLKILKNIQLQYHFLLQSYDENRGKGAAIRAGFKKASGDIIIIQDADAEYDPKDWKIILNELKMPETLVVFGSRNLNPRKKGYWHFILGVKFLTGLINFLFNSKLTDSYTCYKVFKRSALNDIDLVSNGFEIEAEMTIKFLKKGIFIKEVPISYNPRSFFEGKKISFVDGLIGLWTIIKLRFL